MADEFTLTPTEPGPRRGPAGDEAEAHRNRTINVMRRRYGPAPEGARCRDCAFLIRSGGGDGSFLKCKAFRISCSRATDWRMRWPGCGKFAARSEAIDGRARTRSR